MPSITFTQPDGSSYSVGMDLDELVKLVLRPFTPSKDNYLNYELAHSAKAYGDAPWVQAVVDGTVLKVPYIMEYDYRIHPVTDMGRVQVRSPFSFPAELSEHKKRMHARFVSEGLLYKGDSFCPRVADFTIDGDGLPHFEVEQARYTDQIGTNLTLDFPLSHPLERHGRSVTTVREWDAAALADLPFRLPALGDSQLANTIGVSIGLTCRTRSGQRALLRRRRAKNTAVYAGMWASPFAFALSMPKDIAQDTTMSMKDLILFDIGIEFEEEIGLDRSLFTSPKPVAFCRDLVRGGKPQFFFEMSTDLEFEEIAALLGKKSKEYGSRVSIERSLEGEDHPSVAPELACFIALMAQTPVLPAQTNGR